MLFAQRHPLIQQLPSACLLAGISHIVVDSSQSFYAHAKIYLLELC